MRQVDMRKELLDQLLAKLALHKRIGSNHANITGRLRIMTIDSKVKKTLSERHRKRVLSMAGREAIAIRLVERCILNRNIGRIPHHHMILLPENAVQLSPDPLYGRHARYPLRAGDPQSHPGGRVRQTAARVANYPLP